MDSAHVPGLGLRGAVWALQVYADRDTAGDISAANELTEQPRMSVIAMADEIVAGYARKYLTGGVLVCPCHLRMNCQEWVEALTKS